MSRIFKLILGSALMGQAVMAQPSAQPSAGLPSTGQPSSGAASDADISVRQRPTLGPQEMLSQASDYRRRIDSISKEVQGLVDRAKRDKDVIKLNCLMDKLAQLKANLAVADSGLQSLQDAISRRDEGQSVHEYTRITIVNQKAQVLGAEGKACVGEDISYVGSTKVDVEQPYGAEDPTGPRSDDINPAVDRPPAASPSE